MAYQSASMRQSENLSPAGETASQWVRFAVIVVAAALNTKAMTLWSESRMLRKVRARHHRQLRNSLISEHRDHAFVELYVSLSKGRHRTYSRYFPLLYYAFLFTLDAIDVIELLARGSFNPDVTSSEELTAFRLLIYVGSFATFGAAKLTIAQSLLLVFCNVTIATLQVLFGYGILRVSGAVRYVFIALQSALIGGFFFVRIIQDYGERQASLPGIVAIMASVRENNFQNPNLERIDLRKGLSKRQSTSLETMEKLATQYENFDAERARDLVSWWGADFGDFMVFFVVSALNAMVWGQASKDQVPRIAFLSCLEATSTFLLFINNTMIEKILFVKLLQIGRIQKSGSTSTGTLVGHGNSRTV